MRQVFVSLFLLLVSVEANAILITYDMSLSGIGDRDNRTTYDFEGQFRFDDSDSGIIVGELLGVPHIRVSRNNNPASYQLGSYYADWSNIAVELDFNGEVHHIYASFRVYGDDRYVYSIYAAGTGESTEFVDHFGNDRFFDQLNYKRISMLSPSFRVPEPATLALMGLGLAGLSFARRKQKSNS